MKNYMNPGIFRSQRKVMIKDMKKVLAIAALLTAGVAHAETPQWKLTERTGTVNILRAGVSKIAMMGGSLKIGDVIATGEKSRAVLVRGQEFVVVSPNSRLRISAPKQSGGIVQFFEEIGNVLFRIDKKATPHFGVATPYLAAVVKGTTFSVTVSESGTAVQVTEGAVQVSTLDGGATQLLSPGMIGIVNRDQQFRLNITGSHARTIDSPNAPAGSSDTPEPMDEATLVEIANGSFEGTISAPVLEAPVSLSQLTGGLVSSGAPSNMSTKVAAVNPAAPAFANANNGVNNGNPGAVGNGNGNPFGSQSDNSGNGAGNGNGNPGGNGNGNPGGNGNGNPGGNGNGNPGGNGNGNPGGNGNGNPGGNGNGNPGGNGNGNSGGNGNGNPGGNGNGNPGGNGNGNPGGNGNGNPGGNGNGNPGGNGNGNPGGNGNGNPGGNGNGNPGGNGNGNPGGNGNGNPGGNGKAK